MVFNRKIAYVDLSKKEVTIKDISKKMRRMYLGGRGINTYLRSQLIKPGIDPIGPENVLFVGAGFLSAIPGLGSGRCDIAAKSPLTGAVGDANMGGFFAPEMRFAGFDHLVVTGKADAPVYIWIHDGEVEIRDASHLWGKDVHETQEIIRKDHREDEIQCLLMGLAGENLVRYANVMTGLKNSGGRTGMGCVMGSKKLKAVAARGTMDLEFAHPDELLEYCQEMNKKIMSTKFARAMTKWGDMVIYSNTGNTGLVRVRNFQYNKMDKPEPIECENMDKYSIGTSACFGCQIGCRHRYIVKEGPYAPFYDEGPEYTSQGAFGTEPDIPSMESVVVGNHLVNKYGLDTLEVGNMIAWAMELYEKGIIDEKMTGVKLEWGNAEVMYEMIEKIAKREGFGDVLADGLKPAIEKIGKESEYYGMHVKGMGNLHSDERPTPALALNIATSSRGADHLRSRPAIDLYGLPEKVLEEIYGGGPISSLYTSYVGKSREVVWQEQLYSVVDSLGLCKYQTVFISVNSPKYEEWVNLLHYATGMEFTKEELITIGERIYTLERMFNLKEGFTRKDDTLPERFFKEPTNRGLPIVKGKKIDRKKFNQMIKEYYELHAWNEEGIPTEETLKKLGLDEEIPGIL